MHKLSQGNFFFFLKGRGGDNQPVRGLENSRDPDTENFERKENFPKFFETRIQFPFDYLRKIQKQKEG